MLHNSRRRESRPRAVRRSRSLRHHARASRSRRARRGNPLLYRRTAGPDGGRDRDQRDDPALPAPALAGSDRAGDLQRFLFPARIGDAHDGDRLSKEGESTMAGEVYFNIWDPEFRANPYPHYGPLLAGPPPIVDAGPMKFALVARYADVTAGLRDHEHLSSMQPPPPPEQVYEGRFKGSRNMLGSDPPQHTRLRRLISRDFTPRRIRELEPRIREIAKQLLDKVEAKGEFDLMADIANVLPVTVIAEMLGVPPELNARFKHWSDRIIGGDNNVPGNPPSSEIVRVIDEHGDYFTAEIEKRRANPGQDLVSALVAAHDEGEVMSAADLLSFITLLLVAGNETTTNLIGNGMLALGRNLDQFDALKRSPAMLPRAIEEMLRYDGPVQSTVRFTTGPVQLGGT